MTLAPQETANVTMGGNIPSGGAAFTTTATMYDAQGNVVPLTLTYTPTATANQWTMQATVNGTKLFNSGVTLTFDSTGQLESYAVDGGAATTVTDQAASISTTGTLPTGFNWKETAIKFDFPAPDTNGAVTQYTTSQTVGVATQDGYSPGSLQSWSIGQSGTITGTFTNGQSESARHGRPRQLLEPRRSREHGRPPVPDHRRLGPTPSRHTRLGRARDTSRWGPRAVER